LEKCLKSYLPYDWACACGERDLGLFGSGGKSRLTPEPLNLEDNNKIFYFYPMDNAYSFIDQIIY
jgi:hypothetical protein